MTAANGVYMLMVDMLYVGSTAMMMIQSYIMPRMQFGVVLCCAVAVMLT